MADTKERIYFVDPGIGEKSENCPYSQFDDGRDVTAYIYPPEGYEFKEFKSEPYSGDDHFYDGKIVAQYEKVNFIDTIRPDMWKYVLSAFIIIGLLVALIITVFNKPKTQTGITPENAIAEKVEPVAENHEEPAAETIAYDTVNSEETLEQTAEVTVPPVETKEETKSEAKEEPAIDATQAFSPDADAQFKKEFWNLIQQQETNRAAYGKLFKAYKGMISKADCEEYTYMYKTILKSAVDFKKWNEKLCKIPSDKIKTVQTIDGLKGLLKEYE